MCVYVCADDKKIPSKEASKCMATPNIILLQNVALHKTALLCAFRTMYEHLLQGFKFFVSK
jgi:hypothetical protein